MTDERKIAYDTIQEWREYVILLNDLIVVGITEEQRKKISEIKTILLDKILKRVNEF